MSPNRVLLIDCDDSVLRTVRRYLAPACTVVTATSAAHGLTFARDGEFDAILCQADAIISEKGIAALYDALGPSGRRRLILITANTSFSGSMCPTLMKPFSKAELLYALSLVAEKNPVSDLRRASGAGSRAR